MRSYLEVVEEGLESGIDDVQFLINETVVTNIDPQTERGQRWMEFYGPELRRNAKLVFPWFYESSGD